jgi:hypothetical protein
VLGERRAHLVPLSLLWLLALEHTLLSNCFATLGAPSIEPEAGLLMRRPTRAWSWS